MKAPYLTRGFPVLLAGAILSLAAANAWAQQMIGVPARKLVVVDKLATSSKASLVFAAKDSAITKGVADDPNGIGVLFSLSYDSALGSFFVMNGAFDGVSGWVSNDSTGARFVNELAPNGGGTQVQKVDLKEARRLLLKARGTGDLRLDLFAAGPPSGTVSTLYCFSNGPDQLCHCTQFSDCRYKLVAGGAGAKLVCRRGAADPTCNTGP